MISLNKNIFRKFTIVIVTFLLMFTSTGCDALRKKFTRKKKETTLHKGPLPILEPIDYPGKKEYGSEELYTRAYRMFQVWSKELASTLEHSTNDKNLRYLIGNIITQISTMKELLNDEKAAELDIILSDYLELQKEFEKSKSLRRTSLLSNNLRLYNKATRINFNPDAVVGNFK